MISSQREDIALGIADYRSLYSDLSEKEFYIEVLGIAKEKLEEEADVSVGIKYVHNNNQTAMILAENEYGYSVRIEDTVTGQHYIQYIRIADFSYFSKKWWPVPRNGDDRG